MIRMREISEGMFLHGYQSSDNDHRSFNSAFACRGCHSSEQIVRSDSKQPPYKDIALCERSCKEPHRVSSKLCQCPQQ